MGFENVLIIEDDEQFRRTLIDLLQRENYEVEGVPDGQQAIEVTKKTVFNLIIADVRLPGGMDGIDTLKKIKEIYEINNYHNKMIVMTGYADEEAPIKAIRLGVDDYIYKPFGLEDFLHAVRRNIRLLHLEREVDLYMQLSIHDGLTNLYNHRYFHEIIIREIDRAARYNNPLSLFMIDIDNFKGFNDAYGHLTGDMALRKLVHLFKWSLRKVDLAFRYGGEEFTIILPMVPKDGSRVAAERLRKTIEETSFDVEGSKKPHLTVSIGIAAYPEDAKDKDSLINFADKALYKAKQLGKNRVCIWQMNGEVS